MPDQKITPLDELINEPIELTAHTTTDKKGHTTLVGFEEKPRVVIPPIKLPTFTFIVGCSDLESEAIAKALTDQDNSLYLEGFRQPVLDAVHALLDATGFDGLLNTPEWTLEVYPGGPTPEDITKELEEALRGVVSLEELAANRVLANQSFNDYQFIFPDATGMDTTRFLESIKSRNAVYLVFQPEKFKILHVAGTRYIPLPTFDPAKVIELLRVELGTL